MTWSVWMSAPCVCMTMGLMISVSSLSPVSPECPLWLTLGPGKHWQCDGNGSWAVPGPGTGPRPLDCHTIATASSSHDPRPGPATRPPPPHYKYYFNVKHKIEFSSHSLSQLTFVALKYFLWQNNWDKKTSWFSGFQVSTRLLLTDFPQRTDKIENVPQNF